MTTWPDEIDEVQSRYIGRDTEYNYPIRMWADVHILLKRVKELKERLNTDVLNQKIEELEDEIETHVRSIGIWKEEEYHKADSKVKELESDLKLNASMLAKQTNLAREAEISLAKLKEAIKRNEIFKRTHEGTISLIDEELYSHIREKL